MEFTWRFQGNKKDREKADDAFRTYYGGRMNFLSQENEGRGVLGQMDGWTYVYEVSSGTAMDTRNRLYGITVLRTKEGGVEGRNESQICDLLSTAISGPRNGRLDWRSAQAERKVEERLEMANELMATCANDAEFIEKFQQESDSRKSPYTLMMEGKFGTITENDRGEFLLDGDPVPSTDIGWLQMPRVVRFESEEQRGRFFRVWRDGLTVRSYHTWNAVKWYEPGKGLVFTTINEFSLVPSDGGETVFRYDKGLTAGLMPEKFVGMVS